MSISILQYLFGDWMQDCSSNNYYLKHHFLIDQWLVFKQRGLCKFKIFIMKSLMDNVFTLLSSPLLIALTKLCVEQRINRAVHTDSSSLLPWATWFNLDSLWAGLHILLSDARGFALGSSGCAVPSSTRQWSCSRQRSMITAHRGIPQASAYLCSLIP